MRHLQALATDGDNDYDIQSCDGCDADGPDNCLKCAEGYSLKNNFCVTDKTASGNMSVSSG